jgi:hypothetical protein
MSNYPDGMSEGDIPGYWDDDCPNCEGEGTEPDAPEQTCHKCDGLGVIDTRDAGSDYDPEPDDYVW